MKLIRKRAYSRAGLVGNPSDGYHGKTLAMIVRNFCAEVVLYEWDTLDIVLAENDRARFASIQDLARDVKLHGYYGGIRLIKAASSGLWIIARPGTFNSTTRTSPCATRPMSRGRWAWPVPAAS